MVPLWVLSPTLFRVLHGASKHIASLTWKTCASHIEEAVPAQRRSKQVITVTARKVMFIQILLYQNYIYRV